MKPAPLRRARRAVLSVGDRVVEAVLYVVRVLLDRRFVAGTSLAAAVASAATAGFYVSPTAGFGALAAGLLLVAFLTGWEA